MKITATKVLRELQENHNWGVYKDLDKYQQDMIKECIKDTLTVVDDILKRHKHLSIK